MAAETRSCFKGIFTRRTFLGKTEAEKKFKKSPSYVRMWHGLINQQELGCHDDVTVTAIFWLKSRGRGGPMELGSGKLLPALTYLLKRKKKKIKASIKRLRDEKNSHPAPGLTSTNPANQAVQKEEGFYFISRLLIPCRKRLQGQLGAGVRGPGRRVGPDGSDLGHPNSPLGSTWGWKSHFSLPSRHWQRPPRGFSRVFFTGFSSAAPGNIQDIPLPWRWNSSTHREKGRAEHSLFPSSGCSIPRRCQLGAKPSARSRPRAINFPFTSSRRADGLELLKPQNLSNSSGEGKANTWSTAMVWFFP
ncbi:uncharacterized protein LOC114001999 isoform X2 [Pipra filicauda]|uniref:Uncharacterized protein LOC114001999 isoform X2 n=1 Tax=Pipra filicauda TaxID=649802 RepID=A0A7R5KU83_9PASS|nr:uncharacterized protein LOC114001999 isoform X2 [Pipra filicauda]